MQRNEFLFTQIQMSSSENEIHDDSDSGKKHREIPLRVTMLFMTVLPHATKSPYLRMWMIIVFHPESSL